MGGSVRVEGKASAAGMFMHDFRPSAGLCAEFSRGMYSGMVWGASPHFFWCARIKNLADPFNMEGKEEAPVCRFLNVNATPVSAWKPRTCAKCRSAALTRNYNNYI